MLINERFVVDVGATVVEVVVDDEVVDDKIVVVINGETVVVDVVVKVTL